MDTSLNTNYATLTGLNLKADKTYVDTSLNTNYATLTGLNLKADKTYVDTSLNNNYYVKSYIDSSFNSLVNDISYCYASNPGKNLNKNSTLSFSNSIFYYNTATNILNLLIGNGVDTSYNFFIPNVRLQ